MEHFKRVPLCQLLAIWRVGAAAPEGAARNALYWSVVDAIRASGRRLPWPTRSRSEVTPESGQRVPTLPPSGDHPMHNRSNTLIDWAIAFAFGVALGTTLALCL